MSSLSVPAFEIKLSNSINGDTFYHIIAFIGYLFLYKGVNVIPKRAI